jgi:hypothetical protein
MIVATSLRALAVGDLTVSFGHAEDIIRLERSLHIYYEPAVQHGFREFQLLGPVGLLYLLSHFGGSGRLGGAVASPSRPESNRSEARGTPDRDG